MSLNLTEITNGFLTGHLKVDGGGRVFFWFSELEDVHPYIPDRLVVKWLEEALSEMADDYYYYGSGGEDGITQNSEIIEELLQHPNAPSLEKMKENVTQFKFWDYHGHLVKVRSYLTFEIVKHEIMAEIWRAVKVARGMVDWLHKNKDQYKISFQELECIWVSVNDSFDGFTIKPNETLTLYSAEGESLEGKEELYALVGLEPDHEGLVVYCDWRRPK